MTPEEQAVADAAAAVAAKEADAAKAKDPAYLEAELKKAIAKRDALAAQVKELTPAAAKLKQIEDAAKSDVQRLTDELAKAKPAVDRAAKLEAQVQATFDAETEGLNDAQKAVIVGESIEDRLAHLRQLKAAGMLGGIEKSTSPGGKLPGEGDPQKKTITKAAWDASSPAKKSELSLKGVRVV